MRGSHRRARHCARRRRSARPPVFPSFQREDAARLAAAGSGLRGPSVVYHDAADWLTRTLTLGNDAFHVLMLARCAFGIACWRRRPGPRLWLVAAVRGLSARADVCRARQGALPVSDDSVPVRFRRHVLCGSCACTCARHVPATRLRHSTPLRGSIARRRAGGAAALARVRGSRTRRPLRRLIAPMPASCMLLRLRAHPTSHAPAPDRARPVQHLRGASRRTRAQLPRTHLVGARARDADGRVLARVRM